MWSRSSSMLDRHSFGYAWLGAIGLLAAIVALVPTTRIVGIVLLWLLGPLVAFGGLVALLRGSVGIRNARVFALGLCCGALTIICALAAMVTGDGTIGLVLGLATIAFNFLAILLGAGSVTTDTTTTNRYVPPADA